MSLWQRRCLTQACERDATRAASASVRARAICSNSLRNSVSVSASAEKSDPGEHQQV